MTADHTKRITTIHAGGRKDTDSKNRRALCKEFGIRQSHMTYDRYWEEIIEQVREADWWNSARPSDKEGLAIWQGRTALLDALYYDPNA